MQRSPTMRRADRASPSSRPTCTPSAPMSAARAGVVVHDQRDPSRPAEVEEQRRGGVSLLARKVFRTILDHGRPAVDRGADPGGEPCGVGVRGGRNRVEPAAGNWGHRFAVSGRPAQSIRHVAHPLTASGRNSKAKTMYSRPLLAMEKRRPRCRAYLDACCIPFDAGSPAGCTSRTAIGMRHSFRRSSATMREAHASRYGLWLVRLRFRDEPLRLPPADDPWRSIRTAAVSEASREENARGGGCPTLARGRPPPAVRAARPMRC